MRLVFIVETNFCSPETFLTYLLRLHNYLLLQCCYAAKTYEDWLIIERKRRVMTDLWAKF